jgi:hypothetical protein
LGIPNKKPAADCSARAVRIHLDGNNVPVICPTCQTLSQTVTRSRKRMRDETDRDKTEKARSGRFRHGLILFSRR